MKQESLMIQKVQINDSCAAYDPLGLCLVTDCLKCENADYRITNSEGIIVRDFKYYGLKRQNIRTEKYLIEFFDEVDYQNIESYLNNENSDYRMTRIYSSENGKENTIMRSSKSDKQKKLDEEQRQNLEYEELLRSMLGEESYQILCKTREQRKKEKTKQVEEKSKIKRLIKKIIRKGE